ncbi:MAG: DUF4126 family protein [Chloroflexota bacterium]
MQNSRPLARTLLLSLATGLRSTSGIAALSRDASTGRHPLGAGPLRQLAIPGVATALTLAQAGEVVADKLPFLPNRTESASLAGRMALGALIGILILRSRHKDPWPAAALDAGVAGVATFAAVRLRVFLTGRGVPNPVAGLLEDGVVVALLRAASTQDA